MTTNTNQESQTETNQLMTNYGMLADLFIYPIDESYTNRFRRIHEYFLTTFPESAEAMNPFMALLSTASLVDVQELFLRSFDVQAITTLDIGFTLFGEDYKRGQLLVHLNKEHRDAGNDCHTELSDHLPNVLRLLDKMKDHVMRDEIATRLVIPAVVKMIAEFSGEKIEKKDVIYKKNLKSILEYSKDYRTVYQSLLEALLITLKKDFNYEEQQEALQTDQTKNEMATCQPSSSCSCSSSVKDYSQIIETEMLIEKD